MNCIHKQELRSTSNRNGQDVTIHGCRVKGRCTEKADHVKLIGLESVHPCEGCSSFEPIGTRIATTMRPKGRFAYVLGSNRTTEPPMMAAVIRSARASGVSEDFHVFAVMDVTGAVNHRIPATLDWRDHMAKLDFMLSMKDSGYDYLCWLDADTYFVRHPGDLSELIRGEKLWVSMESDLQAPGIKFDEWWGLYYSRKTPTIFDWWKMYGAGRVGFWNTNGGLFVLRTNAIEEIHSRCNQIYSEIRSAGYHRIADEVPLAIVGDAMVSDPRLNTFSNHSHVWACDWQGEFRDRLPDGKPWTVKDYLTQSDVGKINPAIVHMMRGKHLLADRVIDPARENQNLLSMPCGHRGERLRVEAKLGGCGLGASPVYSCRLHTEASLWKFCSTQSMARCNDCVERSTT